MNDPRDPIPPGHGEPRVGAAVDGETLRLALPTVAPPVAFTPVCSRCWYQHGPDEECPS